MTERLLRRRFLRLSALVAGTGLLAACSPAAPAASPTAPAAKPTTASAPASPAAQPSAAAATVAASPNPSPSSVAAPSPSAAAAATVDPALASVWQGKTITLIGGGNPGSANDTTMRLLSHHLPRHLPGNPTIIVQNMPGGSNRVATNFVYAAKPDGLTLGLADLNVPYYQLSGEGPEQGVRFDVTKLVWLGTPTVATQMLALSKRAGVTPSTVSLLQSKEVTLANSSPGDSPHVIQVVLNAVLGWKTKAIFGYQDTQSRQLGVDRGEVDGMLSTWDSLRRSKGDDFRSGEWVPALLIGQALPDALLNGVSKATDLFAQKSEADKQLLAVAVQRYDWGRPLFAPPDLPANLTTGLRAAFDATMADPQFLEEAQRIDLDVIPVSGTRVQDLMRAYLQTPKAAVDRLQALIAADSPA